LFWNIKWIRISNKLKTKKKKNWVELSSSDEEDEQPQTHKIQAKTEIEHETHLKEVGGK